MSEATADESTLVQRAQDGDERAFATLVTRYQGPIFRLCSRYLRGADAEDAAQETFVRAFVHRQKIDPKRPILPWLATVARRLCLDRLRKKSPDLEENIEQTGSENGSPESAASSREQLALLQKGLAELPDRQREALVLFHLEGMPYREIAESLEVPVGTVMTWLHRGRAELKKLLTEKGELQATGGGS